MCLHCWLTLKACLPAHSKIRIFHFTTMFTKHSAFLFLPTLQNNLIVSKIAGNLTLLTRTEFFLIFCSNVSHYSEAQGAPLINQGKPKWGGTDGCPRCGKAVYFAEEVRALGKKFHKLCLACGTIHFLLWRFTLKFLYMIFCCGDLPTSFYI